MNQSFCSANTSTNYLKTTSSFVLKQLIIFFTPIIVLERKSIFFFSLFNFSRDLMHIIIRKLWYIVLNYTLPFFNLKLS